MKLRPFPAVAGACALGLLAMPGAFAEAPEPLKLAALLTEAEVSNPEILAARARHEAAGRVPSQMEALPDPTASVSYTNDTLSDLTLGSSEFTTLAFAWTQEIPYPGKRRLAGDVARAENDVSGQLLEAARRRVRAEVKKTYVELLRLDRTATILEESRKLLVSFLESARSRYEAGEGILENVLKAQTEISKLDAELTTTAQERRSAAVQLSMLLGRRNDTPFGPALDAPRLEALDSVALEASARERSPDLLALRASERREESRLSLAHRNLKPDLIWGASYMNRGGLDPMVMGMFGVRLPLYRKQKQAEAIVQSQYALEAARQDRMSDELRVLSEVRDLCARAERARALTQLYAEGILPQAQSALDSAAAAFASGKTEFVTVIGDFLSVLNYEREHERQRADQATALAALEPLTGTELVRPPMEEPVTGTELLQPPPEPLADAEPLDLSPQGLADCMPLHPPLQPPARWRLVRPPRGGSVASGGGERGGPHE